MVPISQIHHKHYYCGEFLLKITDNCLVCPIQKSKKEFNSIKDRCSFIEISVILQLEKLFAKEDFRNKLVNQSVHMNQQIEHSNLVNLTVE